MFAAFLLKIQNLINIHFFQVSQSNAGQVVLSDVTFNLAGNISCEVTTDAPGFSTAIAMKSLMVVGQYCKKHV